jgi:epoxyqueuosine reductase
MDRRNFLKTAGLATGALTLAGAAGVGFAAGKDKDSYTGWGRTAYGKDQFFNRKPFAVEKPCYEEIGPTSRITYIEELFKRNAEMRNLLFPRNPDIKSWRFDDGPDALPDHLKRYYHANPGALDDFRTAMERGLAQRNVHQEYREEYFLAEAFSAAHSSTIRGPGAYPPQPDGKPEVSDFENVNPHGLPLKSPQHGSELIKSITHTFGASLAGIARLREEWVYQGFLRGVGLVDYEVPAHWKNVIIFAMPHEWDSLYAAPNYGTSFDAYSLLRMIAGKLEVFIKMIGYSARSHVPPTSYELVLPPIAIDAGLGEQGRHGMVITPELGANTILAAVTTDMPLEPDKPVDVGIRKFCEKCKICAEECPSGAISFSPKPDQVVRGFKRWVANQHKCYIAWNSIATSNARGCRVCLAVCPYSRKNNWLHNIVRQVDPRDPTGVFASGMLSMQKKFFKYPGGQAYYPPPDGKNASYLEAPKWLKTGQWFEVNH